MRRLAFVLGLLAFAAAVWWALDDASTDDGRGPQALTRDAAATSDAAPVAPLPAAARLDAPSAALAAEAVDAAAPAGSAEWPEGIEPMTVSGRVLDESGAPVAGALVMLLVDIFTASALDRERQYTPFALEPAELPHAIAADDGSFTLRGPWLPDDGVHREFPSLTVRAAGYALHHFRCAGFAGGEFAAGDLVMFVPGAELRARLVDPAGAPLVGIGVGFGMVDLREFEGERNLPRRWDNSASHMRSVSDADGELRVAHLWPGSIRLSFALPEKRWEHFGDVDLGDGFLDLGTVVLDLDGGPRITGLVRDADGAPLPGAFVRIKGYEHWNLPAPDPPGADVAGAWLRFPESRGVSTDADGRYVLRDLDPDWEQHVVAISAPGHEPALLRDVPFDSEAPEVTLRPEAVLVVDARAADDGRALPDAELRAVRVTGTWERWNRDVLPVEVELRTEGSRVLQAGPLTTRVHVAAPGFTPRVLDVEGLQPGETRTVVVELQPASTLSVRVIDDRGEPVSGIEVELRPPEAWGQRFQRVDLGPQLRAVTDADGRTQHCGLARGEWSIRASSPAHFFGVARPCPITGDDTEVELVLDRCSVLLGELLDANGEPVVGMEVIVSRRTSDGKWWDDTVNTDVNGRFAHRTLRAGPVAVLAPRTELLEVQLDVGEVREVFLRQLPPFQLEGRVTSGGEPVADVQVSYSGISKLPDGPSWSGYAHTDALGAYAFDVDTYGRLQVQAAPEVGARAVASVDSRPGAHAVQDFELGTASLGGVVLFPDGELDLEWAQVSLQLPAGRSVRVPLEADGRFHFAPLVAGSYHLHVDVSGMRSLFEGPIELADGEQRDDLELQLEPARGVRGLISWGSGAPFTGTLRARLDGGDSFGAATSVFAGHYDLSELSPGTWELSATPLDFMESLGLAPEDWVPTVPQIVTLEAGVEAELDLVVPGAPPG